MQGGTNYVNLKYSHTLCESQIVFSGGVIFALGKNQNVWPKPFYVFEGEVYTCPLVMYDDS